METIGQRIRAMRERRGLSQEKLGRAIGVTKAVISSWEMDRVKNMQLRNLFALADALDTDARLLALGDINRLAVPISGLPTGREAARRLRVLGK